MLRLISLALALIASAPGADPRPAAMQSALDRAMAGRAGAAVAIDAVSGQILASYHFKVAALRVATPGSTLKPFVLLTLLNSHATPPTLVCRREVRIAGRELDCTHPVSTEPLDAVAALAYSCNSYFATVAHALRNTSLVETFVRAGLASLSGFATVEASGQMIAPTGLESRQLFALGEANILVTPLELLAAYRWLALRRDLPKVIREGLEAAVTYGTARLASAPGVAVAGKTGTSLDPAAGQAHAWFAGFAPAETPRVVVVVFLEQGLGSRDAAPVAGALFRAALPAP